jgi:hypothetical protein
VGLYDLLKATLPADARRRLASVIRYLPRNRAGDVLHALARFYYEHRRLPRSGSLLFNDMMFAILVGPHLGRPERMRITDKELVKGFIAEHVGDDLNVPTVAVLRSREEAAAFAYPDRCVIKPTHSSGRLIIRRDGEPVDRDQIAGWFDENYYLACRERNYRNLQPKVIVEEFALGTPDPDNFKAYCVDGEPRLFHVNVDMHGLDRKSYYDTAWVQLPFVVDDHPRADVPRPANLDRLVEIARRLSAGFPFLRVDMYSDGERIVVGELTNCSGAGLGVFRPPEGEEIASSILWPERGPPKLRSAQAPVRAPALTGAGKPINTAP